MITQKVIDALYKKYRRRPSSIDALDISLLFDYAAEHHNVQINPDGHLVIESIDPRSPFHSVPLANIHGITQFEDTVAIVLHSSIIFLNKADDGVNVHLRHHRPSLWQRLRWRFYHT